MAGAGAVAVVREAQVADFPACAAIANDWIDQTDWIPRVHSHEEIAAMFAPDLFERRRLLVGEAEGQVVGYLSFDPAEARVAAIYVAARAQGLGLGKALMDRAKALSPQGLCLDVFVPNLRAQAFYAREGFAEDPAGRREDTEEGVPTLRYRWVGA